MSAGCALLFSALIMPFGTELFGIFTTDAAVVKTGLRMMHVISPTYFLFTFIEIYSGSLRAQGHVLISTIMTMTGVCLLRIVWTTCIVPNGTLEQIIACYPITWVVTAVCMIVYYFYKQKRILAEHHAV